MIVIKKVIGDVEHVIADDDVLSVHRTHKLFDGVFKLGSASASEWVVEVNASNPLGAVEGLNIYDDDVKIATLCIGSIEDVDGRSFKIIAYDNMVKFDFYYDGSQVEGGTLLDVVEDICDKAGVVLETTTFNSADMSVSWYDNRITGRQYIGYVAELNGGYAFINANGGLEFRRFTNTASANVNADDCSSFRTGDVQVVSRVVFDNGVAHYESGDDTGITIYIDSNNPFVNGGQEEIQEQIDSIYDVVSGLTYCSAEIDDMPIPDLDAGDTIELVYNSLAYHTFWEYDVDFNTEWYGGLKIELGSPEQSEMVQYGAEQIYNSIYTRIDRSNGEMSIIAERVNGQGASISDMQAQIKLNADNISAVVGQVQDIPDMIQDKVDALGSSMNQRIDGFEFQIDSLGDNVDAIGKEQQKVSNLIRLTGRGVEVANTGSNVTGVFASNSLDFYDGNTKLAWLDVDDGLGAPELSVGDANSANLRWRIFATADGKHLRFTRHL